MYKLQQGLFQHTQTTKHVMFRSDSLKASCAPVCVCADTMDKSTRPKQEV